MKPLHNNVLEYDYQIDICRFNIRHIDSEDHPETYVNQRKREATGPIWKRVLDASFQAGWGCGCHEIWRFVMSYPFANQIVLICTRLFEWVSGSAQPSMLARLAAISETRDFDKALVRFIAWHPRDNFLAIANGDDIVLQYDVPHCRNIYDEPLSPMLLFSNEQKQVSCVAYSPDCTLQLAVGCAEGVCLWNSIDRQNIRSLTQSRGCYHMLRSRSHRYITALQWNHNGQFLLSSSLGDSTIIVWEPDRFSKVRFVYIGASYTLLKWSPNETCVFGARTNRWISLWQTKSPVWKRYISQMDGCIQTAAWSTCSNFLLFVLKDSSQLMAFFFQEMKSAWIDEEVKVSDQVRKVGDFNKSHCVCRNPTNKPFGGTPHAMTIDPLGKYLAVIYKDQSYVGLYSPIFDAPSIASIVPLYSISSRQHEYPTCICFEGLSNYETSAHMHSTLTIAWSSGCVILKTLELHQDAFDQLQKTNLPIQLAKQAKWNLSNSSIRT